MAASIASDPAFRQTQGLSRSHAKLVAGVARCFFTAFNGAAAKRANPRCQGWHIHCMCAGRWQAASLVWTKLESTVETQGHRKLAVKFGTAARQANDPLTDE